MDYTVIWFEAGEPREMRKDSAQEAITFAKGMIDAGRPGVEVRMPRTKSVIRGQTILDIYDAIEELALVKMRRL